mmetsp:Transcript_1856/g.3145  ORF Transcript_1856/g.3145 Transcript_1856/m.3145 type:complete len:206 (-) Transcript_1856:128-745(-)
MISFTSLTSTRLLSIARIINSNFSICHLYMSTFSSRVLIFSAFLDFFLLELDADSMSASAPSHCEVISAILSDNHDLQSSAACCSSVNLLYFDRPSFEYAFVLVSLSRSLKRSIRTSTVRRASSKAALSRISGLAVHPLTCSRRRCNFLISFFKSCSYFSFCEFPRAPIILSKVSSNDSAPSLIFLSTRSTSTARHMTIYVSNPS